MIVRIKKSVCRSTAVSEEEQQIAKAVAAQRKQAAKGVVSKWVTIILDDISHVHNHTSNYPDSANCVHTHNHSLVDSDLITGDMRGLTNREELDGRQVSLLEPSAD